MIAPQAFISPDLQDLMASSHLMVSSLFSGVLLPKTIGDPPTERNVGISTVAGV